MEHRKFVHYNPHVGCHSLQNNPTISSLPKIPVPLLYNYPTLQPSDSLFLFLSSPNNHIPHKRTESFTNIEESYFIFTNFNSKILASLSQPPSSTLLCYSCRETETETESCTTFVCLVVTLSSTSTINKLDHFKDRLPWLCHLPESKSLKGSSLSILILSRFYVDSLYFFMHKPNLV